MMSLSHRVCVGKVIELHRTPNEFEVEVSAERAIMVGRFLLFARTITAFVWVLRGSPHYGDSRMMAMALNMRAKLPPHRSGDICIDGLSLFDILYIYRHSLTY